MIDHLESESVYCGSSHEKTTQKLVLIDKYELVNEWYADLLVVILFIKLRF